MSDLMVEFWLLLVMAFSVAALSAAMVLTHGQYWFSRDKIFRVGFILLCLGLGVQCYRSIHFLMFHYYPLDHYFPTWIVKDAGFILIVWSEFNASRKGT
jgi:hypothetical protein